VHRLRILNYPSASVSQASGRHFSRPDPSTSGDATPSNTDIKVTRDLIRAGQLPKIEILDHVIVGSPGSEAAKPYSSLRELGYCL
jgi:hypothetical protein